MTIADCDCAVFNAPSLVPNPSFEEKSCCPNGNAQLYCALEWIQASSATTDYIHTCDGYLGNNSIGAMAPLPFPDGDGCVGFRDGQANTGPFYKEYVGACLNNSLKVGVAYSLDFFVGFQENKLLDFDFNVMVYASTNCDILPFGNRNPIFGCPMNTGKFVTLGQLNIVGNNEWKKVHLEFTPEASYNVIVIGSSCEANPNYLKNPYYFIDDLSLSEKHLADSTPINPIGSPCDDNFMLNITHQTQNTYQWYKNGIILAGENKNTIRLSNSNNANGNYQVIVSHEENCYISDEYSIRLPPYYTNVMDTICEGDIVAVGGQSYTESGYFERTIPAVDGCDSIIQLSLNVKKSTTSFLRDTFCIGDRYSYWDIDTDAAGTYHIILQNKAGCDSLVTLELISKEQEINITVKKEYSIDLGETITIIPSLNGGPLESIRWVDESGQLLSIEAILVDYLALKTSTIYLLTTDRYGCNSSINININVNKNKGFYIPNVFSPYQEEPNNIFKFYSTDAIAEVELFFIYDRWGNQVFSDKNISELNNYSGWDGTFNNQLAQEGVYSYIIKVRYIDHTIQSFQGDLTLIR